ncbi:leucine rich adaptor protein 1-like isoform X1 [Seriola aureovittata]|uniref:leucine rich adaptor protein 1-like isoform X1 n=2 Tax=Seriola aureovittata TaxID=2871759 RepID=UPI0024BE901B|nr:leucine rich adaptor protein 1-like isoform X1 [Seriola aureovittata]XP_056246494.1 leucine rich adaptor protein 1-like isoform X1 [Seriola aureovittata]
MCVCARVKERESVISHSGSWKGEVTLRTNSSPSKEREYLEVKECGGGGGRGGEGGMAEERLDDSFPELKEVENKIGRKTPESLLMWMRDAADCGDGWRSDVVDNGDHSSELSGGFSDKISSLKQEMRWLRSADVRILRQLVAVHEGIEAMRWLMEERGALVSRGSSLTGSLSSLVTVEEGPSGTPCRESPSPTCPHTDDGDSDHKSYFDVLSPESTEARPHSPSNFNSEVSGSTHGRHGLASSNPANGSVGASLQKSQPQDLDMDPFEDVKAGTIRRALLRSNRPRNKVDTGSLTLAQESGETQTEDSLPQESFDASQSKMMEEESSPPDGEKLLLGYDAQWCWVESQDDVTFL